MTQNIKKPELVAPGGSLEKLKIAATYGADAVYIGSPGLNLRTRSTEFSIDDVKSAADFLHDNGKKLYVAMNIFAKNRQLALVKDFLNNVSGIPIDALIISDPGVITIAREIVPHIPVHLSTQANTTNVSSVNFWHKNGVKRVVLARELSMDEVGEINSGSDCETEVFVHGAMCMSYSGRCLLSTHMTGRSGNLGDCAHSCRWKYSLKEKTRPDELFPVMEDEHGTYILSSQDLCMIQSVPALMQSGVSAWKIEGRMKSIYYVASVTRIYREAIDHYYDGLVTNGSVGNFRFNEGWLDELDKVSHRTYSSGFFFGDPVKDERLEKADGEKNSGYVRNYKIIGLIEDVLDNNMARICVKNKIRSGYDIEIMGKNTGQDFTQKVTELYDCRDEEPLEDANPGQTVLMKMDGKVEPLFMIRENSVVKDDNCMNGRESEKCESTCMV